MKKSVAFPYTSNEFAEKNPKSNPIHNRTPRPETMGIKSNKPLHLKFFKKFMKEIDTKRWKDHPCSQIGRILLHCPYYQK